MTKKKSNSVKAPIIIIGSGGHSRVVAGLIDSLKKNKIVAIVDSANPKKPEKIWGVSVVGNWNRLQTFLSKAKWAVIAIGDNALRSQIFKKVLKIGFKIPTLIHPTAVVDPSASIGQGAQICMGAIIGVNANIGEGAIINSGAIVDHETIVEPFAHIAPGVKLAGRVHIGRESFIGIGTVVKEKIQIGAKTTVGAGSVVVKNIPAQSMALGVPAKVRRG